MSHLLNDSCGIPHSFENTLHTSQRVDKCFSNARSKKKTFSVHYKLMSRIKL